ncbi:MAG: hypothetical protein ACOY3L_17710 [Pseudomonadota bacterium]|jgi:hypothetical protein
MNNPTRHTRTPAAPTPGFTIRIEEHTELSGAFLIAEFDGGGYQPLGGVISIAEARGIAQDDLRRRMRDLEAGGDPPCPEEYVVWARGIGGAYQVAARLAP